MHAPLLCQKNIEGDENLHHPPPGIGYNIVLLKVFKNFLGLYMKVRSSKIVLNRKRQLHLSFCRPRLNIITVI